MNKPQGYRGYCSPNKFGGYQIPIPMQNTLYREYVQKNDLTFFDSIKYKSAAKITKSKTCITTSKLENFLPKELNKIIVDNVLFELCNVIKKIYLRADIDYPDKTLAKPTKKNFKDVKFGNNVLVGKNVKIGKNSEIGANSIIEHDVIAVSYTHLTLPTICSV